MVHDRGYRAVFRGAALNTFAHAALILAAWFAVERFPVAFEGVAGGWPTAKWLVAALATPLVSLLAVVLLLPLIWLFYSIHRYFGFSHALGADHYFEEHRTRELCRRGIFRYVPNAMYTVGFLSFWAIAIAYRSQAALIVAAFNHVSIWIHYFALERPDMRRIYGPRPG